MKILMIVYILEVVNKAKCDSVFEWSYKDEALWPGRCQHGTQQSPINIISKNAILDLIGARIEGPLIFQGYEFVNLKAQNTGRTLKWMLDGNGPNPVLSGGPLNSNYNLVEIHMHWLSEHAIDGVKYPLEIHLVHVKNGLTIAEGFKRSDGLTIVVTLCQVNADDNSQYNLRQLEFQLPLLFAPTTGDGFPITLDLTRLMSQQQQSYYTYNGSRTTPNCEEVVTWIVLDHPISITDAQYKIFRQVNVGGFDNYRSLQPTNRVVYRSATSNSSPRPIGILGALLGVTSLIKSTVDTVVCLYES